MFKKQCKNSLAPEVVSSVSSSGRGYLLARELDELFSLVVNYFSYLLNSVKYLLMKYCKNLFSSFVNAL